MTYESNAKETLSPGFYEHAVPHRTQSSQELRAAMRLGIYLGRPLSRGVNMVWRKKEHMHRIIQPSNGPKAGAPMAAGIAQ